MSIRPDFFLSSQACSDMAYNSQISQPRKRTYAAMSEASPTEYSHDDPSMRALEEKYYASFGNPRVILAEAEKKKALESLVDAGSDQTPARNSGPLKPALKQKRKQLNISKSSNSHESTSKRCRLDRNTVLPKSNMMTLSLPRNTKEHFDNPDETSSSFTLSSHTPITDIEFGTSSITANGFPWNISSNTYPVQSFDDGSARDYAAVSSMQHQKPARRTGPNPYTKKARSTWNWLNHIYKSPAPIPSKFRLESGKDFAFPPCPGVLLTVEEAAALKKAIMNKAQATETAPIPQYNCGKAFPNSTVRENVQHLLSPDQFTMNSVSNAFQPVQGIANLSQTGQSGQKSVVDALLTQPVENLLQNTLKDSGYGCSYSTSLSLEHSNSLAATKQLALIDPLLPAIETNIPLRLESEDTNVTLSPASILPTTATRNHQLEQRTTTMPPLYQPCEDMISTPQETRIESPLLAERMMSLAEFTYGDQNIEQNATNSSNTMKTVLGTDLNWNFTFENVETTAPNETVVGRHNATDDMSIFRTIVAAEPGSTFQSLHKEDVTHQDVIDPRLITANQPNTEIVDNKLISNTETVNSIMDPKFVTGTETDKTTIQPTSDIVIDSAFDLLNYNAMYSDDLPILFGESDFQPASTNNDTEDEELLTLMGTMY